MQRKDFVSEICDGVLASSAQIEKHESPVQPLLTLITESKGTNDLPD
jgi:hypothetical protein